MDPRPISNSEVGSWLQCTQKYWWEFVLNLAPKQLSDPLTYGNLEHDGFQAYALCRLNGMSHDSAMAEVHATYWLKMMEATNDPALVMHAMDIWNRYHAWAKGWPDWEIIGTEQRLDLKITDEYSLPMRYDLLVRDHKTGKLLLVDYKLTYDFWQQEKHDMNIQFPKYLSVLNANGYEVQGAMLIELRYRKMKDMSNDKHFKHTPYFPSHAIKRNALVQHVKASKQIVEFRNLPEKQQEEAVTPVLLPHICKYCDFQQLCLGKLHGANLDYTIETQYGPKDYGYEPIEEEVGEI